MDKMSMEIREIDECDMPALKELEVAVFHGEQGIPEESVMAGLPDEVLWWGCYDEDALIGAVCAWREDGIFHWGRFCIHPEYRGRGLAKKLAARSLHDIFIRDTDLVLTEARDSTVAILLKMGAEITGPAVVFYGSNVTPMRIGKVEFLNAMSSAE